MLVVDDGANACATWIEHSAAIVHASESRLFIFVSGCFVIWMYYL